MEVSLDYGLIYQDISKQGYLIPNKSSVIVMPKFALHNLLVLKS